MFYKRLFYFDIKTVGNYPTFNDLCEKNEIECNLFLKRFHNMKWDKEYGENNINSVSESYIDNSPLYTQYGKIVCISFGYFNPKNDEQIIIKSICDKDEKDILIKFANILYRIDKSMMPVCGYKIKYFDIPWINTKFNKYDIQQPNVINTYLKKPWEVKSVDLSDEFKFLFKNSSTLSEVSYFFNVDSTEDRIEGSQIHKLYWENNDVQSIKQSNEKDLLTTIRIAQKMFQFKEI